MKMDFIAKERGSASVIVIMVMLLLVVFGILAFVSGGSSLNLAEKNARTVKDYYLLDKKAEIATGQISTLIRSHSGAELIAEIQKETGVQAVTALPQNVGEPVIALEISDPAINDRASLRVKLQPKSGINGITGIEIMEWKLIYKPFVYDETVNLWEGVE